MAYRILLRSLLLGDALLQGMERQRHQRNCCQLRIAVQLPLLVEMVIYRNIYYP